MWYGETVLVTSKKATAAGVPCLYPCHRQVLCSQDSNIVTYTICGHDLCCPKYLVQLPAIRFRLASFSLMLHSLLLINSNPPTKFGISSALVHSPFLHKFCVFPLLLLCWTWIIFVQASFHPEAAIDILLGWLGQKAETLLEPRPGPARLIVFSQVVMEIPLGWLGRKAEGL